MKPQLLLFDLDGTLIDSRADLASAVNRMRALHDLAPLPLDTVVSYVGDGVRLLAVRSLQGAAIDPDRAMAEIAKAYAKHLTDATTAYPGVDAGLRALKAAGHTLALITNKPGVHARALCEHFGWTNLFAVLLGGGDTDELKPSPMPLRLAMKHTGFAPADTWMIGDHHTDLEAARHAGVRSVFLENGIGHAGNLTPDVSVPGFVECTAAFLPPLSS